MPDDDWVKAKFAEIERRMMAMEEIVGDLRQRVFTHEAVCLERQKTALNMFAALEVSVGKVADMVDALSNRFIGWHTGVTSAFFVIILGLVGYLWNMHK